MQSSNTKAARTRQFIIEATAEVFNQKGYAGTSVSDLTTATQLTKGSIYGNFENKEEVAAAAFDFNWGKIKKMIAVKIEKSTTAKDKLMAYTELYKNVANNTLLKGGCPILNTAIEADDTNPLLRKKAAQALIGWKNNIAGIIKEGIANGEFKEETPLQETALSLIALIEGGIMIARLTGSMDYLSSIVKTAAQQIDAICTQ